MRSPYSNDTRIASVLGFNEFIEEALVVGINDDSLFEFILKKASDLANRLGCAEGRSLRGKRRSKEGVGPSGGVS